MNSDKLEQSFAHLEMPVIDKNIRANAISQAVAEFESCHQAKNRPSAQLIQRFLNLFRPTGFTRMTYYGLATACVGLVSWFLIFLVVVPPELRMSLPSDLRISEPRGLNLSPESGSDESVTLRSYPLYDAVPEVAYYSQRNATVEQFPAEKIESSYDQGTGRDRFENFDSNLVKRVAEQPVSTFSIDVDTSSYSFVRRQLNNGLLPQKDAVRAEELINYFDYNYELAEASSQPFKPSVSVVPSPWAKGNKLVHIGIKGYEITAATQPRSNLVFLLDVSGSMNSPDKLPLVKQSMGLLLDSLKPDDTVGIVVYAGAAGMVLEPTQVMHKQKILGALNRLQAGGSTAGAQGIKLAYQLAELNYEKEAVNRIILATDGDFNVGITSREELQGFVERKRKKGIFLSLLGFGQGNYHDHMMQVLAQNGNGVAAYIDTLSEAQKILVSEASSTLFPIAKDVKIQVEFNPARVSEYRLIGYETRQLDREDFNNDAVDAGDIGAGHTVTAIYEITPTDSAARLIGDSRYTEDDPITKEAGNNSEYAFLKIRYKLPDSDQSTLLTKAITDQQAHEIAEQDTNFASAVAAFAQILKGGKYTGNYGYDEIINLAQNNKGDDKYGYRTEFIQLVRKARTAAAM